MAHATTLLAAADRAAIEQAAAEAERRTSAEIVCAVATESGRYDRAESLAGLVGSLIALAVAHYIASPPSGEAGAWVPAGGLSLAWESFAVAAGFAAFAVLASHAHGLRRVFTSQREMEDEVARAAAHVFVTQCLASTRARGGVLIYVSLYERKVAVLADEGVMKALGQPFLDELRDLAVTRLRRGDSRGTFLEVVRLAAERLAQPLPPTAGDTDEVPTHLRVFHPRP